MPPVYIKCVEDYLANRSSLDYRSPLFYIVQYLTYGRCRHEDQQLFADAQVIFDYSIMELQEYRVAGKTGSDIATEIMARPTRRPQAIK